MELHHGEVRQLLNELGMYPNLQGYRYLVETIVVLGKVGDGFRITKDGYPEVAKRMHTRAIRVERACRYIIDRTYSGYSQLWLDILNIRERPTVSEFVWHVLMYFEDYCLRINA